MSVYALGIIGSGPIGSLGAGFSVQIGGIAVTCGLYGGTMLAVVCLVWFLSGIRRME
jgi:hypothetical protein